MLFKTLTSINKWCCALFLASMAADASNTNETEDPKDLSQEEMRRLLERNELVGGGSHLQPFDPSNVRI